MQLAQLYGVLDDDQKKTLAQAAGISLGYLWQLATQWKGKKPSIEVVARLAAADQRLTVADLVQEFTSKPAGAGTDVAMHASPEGVS